MYFLKKHRHFLLLTFLLSCFAIIDCNAQVDNTRNSIRQTVPLFTECLVIYPNPADNQIILKIPDNILTQNPVPVQIIFLETKAVVEEIIIDRYRLLDTSNYPNGSYIAIPVINNVNCSGTKFQVFHK